MADIADLMAHMDHRRERDDSQEQFFGMPIETTSFKVERGVGATERDLSYNEAVTGTFAGRVSGVEFKDGKRIWKIEALEVELDA